MGLGADCLHRLVNSFFFFFLSINWQSHDSFNRITTVLPFFLLHTPCRAVSSRVPLWPLQNNALCIRISLLGVKSICPNIDGGIIQLVRNLCVCVHNILCYELPCWTQTLCPWSFCNCCKSVDNLLMPLSNESFPSETPRATREVHGYLVVKVVSMLV